jgi:hypothetical protein
MSAVCSDAIDPKALIPTALLPCCRRHLAAGEASLAWRGLQGRGSTRLVEANCSLRRLADPSGRSGRFCQRRDEREDVRVSAWRGGAVAGCACLGPGGGQLEMPADTATAVMGT